MIERWKRGRQPKRRRLTRASSSVGGIEIPGSKASIKELMKSNKEMHSHFILIYFEVRRNFGGLWPDSSFPTNKPLLLSPHFYQMGIDDLSGNENHSILTK
jgi:hypothetical protein